MAFYAAFAALFTWQGWWLDFLLLWIVPYCTWHIVVQYIRLIAEHSAIESSDSAFGDTRTTIPTLWESLLILPHSIGYHFEHHWYPSVPFYQNGAQCSAHSAKRLGGGVARLELAQEGASCPSMYCLMTERGAPPHVTTQYERLQKTRLE